MGMSYMQSIIDALLKDMSQDELAREIGSDQATISRWKAGVIPANLDRGVRLIEIAKQRGIDVEKLPVAHKQTHATQEAGHA